MKERQSKPGAKRYLGAIIAGAAFSIFILAFPAYREQSLSMMTYQAKTMLLVIPPIFVLLGLLDIWVPREKMIKYMGKDSGLKGPVLAFLLGSFAAGPLYGAFPVAAAFFKKRGAPFNIMIFFGAGSTQKNSLLLFETSALGKSFAPFRFAI